MPPPVGASYSAVIKKQKMMTDFFEKPTTFFRKTFKVFLKRFCVGWKDLCEFSSKTPLFTNVFPNIWDGRVFCQES